MAPGLQFEQFVGILVSNCSFAKLQNIYFKWWLFHDNFGENEKNGIQLALRAEKKRAYIYTTHQEKKGVLLHRARKEVTHTWFVHLPEVLWLSC